MRLKEDRTTSLEIFKVWNTSISDGNLEHLKHLVECKELRVKDSIHGLSPLHLAAIHNQPAICQFLISEGISPSIREDFSGKTPLHFAAYFGHLEAAEMLITLGADAGGKNSSDVLACLPVPYAALGEKEKMLFLLLKQGHLIDPRESSQASFGVSTPSYLGNVLDILIRKRNFALSDLFSSVEGIDSVETNPRVRSILYIGYGNENPWTPFHSAAALGEKAILDMLLHKFPHAYCLSNEFKRFFDYFPAEVALLEGHSEIAAQLGEKRSISDCRQAFNTFAVKDGSPPYIQDLLTSIVERNFESTIQLLEKHGEGILYEASFYEPSRSLYRIRDDLNAFSVISRCFCASIAKLFERRKISISPDEFLERDKKELVFFNWAFINIHPLATTFFNQIKKLCGVD